MSGIINFFILFAAGYTLGTGRTVPTIAAAVGLIGVVAGGLALARPASVSIGKPTAIVAGLVSLAVGGLHAVYAAGGLGTGNGLAGAVVAVALGVIGIALGAIAHRRVAT